MKRRNKSPKNTSGSSYVYVVLSIAMVLFMMGVLGLLLMNARSLGHYVKEQLPVELFFKESVSDEQAKSFVDSVQSLSYVKTLRYIDKNQAIKTAKKELNIADEDLFEARIFPASIKLTINSSHVQPEMLNAIIKTLAKNTLLDEIKYPKDLLRKIHENIERWSLWIICLTFLFLIISIVLINNAVRLNLYSKRFTIKTMQLVGAKRGFIYKPFLSKSLWLGFLGALIAILFLALTSYYFYNHIELPYQQDPCIISMLAAFLVGTGILISLISTYFSVRKFLNLKTHQLYHA